MPKTLVRIDIDAEPARAAAGLGLDPSRLRRRRCRRWRRCLRRAWPRTTARHGPRRRETRPLPELDARHAPAARARSRRSAMPCPARSSSAIRRSRSTPPTSITTMTGRAAGSMPRPATARWATAPPAAIGAALAAPDAPVVCLTGDGGFQFTMPELGAATRCRRAGHLRRLEQSRLSRDRDVDAAMPASNRSAYRRRRRIS